MKSPALTSEREKRDKAILSLPEAVSCIDIEPVRGWSRRLGV